jgi:hypothetical protein
MLITNGKISRNIDPKRFEEYKAKGYVEVKPEKVVEKTAVKGKK